MATNDIKFIFPIDGDVLFSTADGIEKDDVLTTKITAAAPKNSKIFFNGVPAVEKDGIYTADIKLDAYRNMVELKDEVTGYKEDIAVYWFKGGYKKYRICIDDVIWCFEDIYKNNYASIFENPFLGLYKKLHDKYNNHIQMHIYYQNDDNSFNLSMFSDKYKQEFKANSNWLKFTFHAYKNEPDNPYLNATYEEAVSDGKKVISEIRRFAGDEVLSHVTAQHWGNSNIYATRGFRALGYKVLQAYFIFDEDGNPAVSYYLNKEQTKHAATRDFWVDTKEDIIFVKDDIIINEIALDKINGYLDSTIADNKQQSFLNLLIHEQYFYKDYINYESDYEERVFASCQWAVEHGYTSSFMSDFALEK